MDRVHARQKGRVVLDVLRHSLDPNVRRPDEIAQPFKPRDDGVTSPGCQHSVDAQIDEGLKMCQRRAKDIEG